MPASTSRSAWLPVVLLLLAALAGPAAAQEPLPAVQIPLEKAWHNGTQVLFYQFGETADTPVPVYAFFYSNGTQVPGQFNVFDQMRRNIFKGVKEDSNYSDFWLLHKVTVPDGYASQTLRSKEAIERSGYPVEKTAVVINCPFVPRDSTLKDDPAKRPLQHGWYRGNEVHYYIFESNAKELTPDAYVPDLRDPKTGKVKLSTYFEFDKELEKKGQLPVVDSILGEPKYSPLWTETKVKAPAGYAVNSLRSEREVAAKLDDKTSGFAYTTGENKNFPIVGTAGPAGSPPAPTGAGNRSPSQSPSQLANPASVNCIEKGGKLRIVEGPGGQRGMCDFPNGTTCEEWALFRGECPAAPTPRQPGFEAAATLAALSIAATLTLTRARRPGG